MTFEQLINSLAAINPFFILKIFFLIGLVFYMIFSLVVLRQVHLMLDVLGGSSQDGLNFIALIHLLVVVFLFIIAIVVL